MTEHLNRFRRSRPDAIPLGDATEEERDVLLRAENKRYITLVRAPGGQVFYTAELLEQALMWEEKGVL